MNETLEPDLRPDPEAEPEPERRVGKKKGLIIAGGVLLVLLLAGAAFVGGRLLNKRAAAGNIFTGGPLGEKVMSGGEPGMSVSGEGFTREVKVLPAKELPAVQPEASGIYVRREDNSVFIGTGKLSIGVVLDGRDGGVESDYDGPVVEVVVTQETKLYKDATQIKEKPAESADIQQEVKPGSLDELGTDSMVTVWGKKVGDRIIAEVMMYSEPAIMVAPIKSSP